MLTETSGILCIFALLSDSFRIINNTQPISPVGVVLVNFLAGIRKNRSPTSKATVESVGGPGFLKKGQICILTNDIQNLLELNTN